MDAADGPPLWTRELLNAVVASVGDVDASAPLDGDATRTVELPVPAARAAPRGEEADTGGGIHEPPRTPRTLSRKLLLSRHTPPPPVSRTPAVDGLLAAVVDDQ